MSKKVKINDPIFSKRVHKGTASSPSDIGYHYQKYSNIMEYLKLFRENTGKKFYVFPGDIFANLINLNLNSMSIKPYTISEKLFRRNVNTSKKVKYCPLVLSVDILDDGDYDSHANIIMINNESKTIELFEPHGHRTESSELGDITAAYSKKSRILKKYFKKLLPDYKFLNVVDYVKKTAFQILYDPDEHTGYCVTWSTLYAEYRLLNPNISAENLIKHIDKKVTTKNLLKYSAKVEDTLKNAKQ